MSATRTQVYFSEEQRRLIDEVAAREGVTLAEIVRRALDSYLDGSVGDASVVLESTFGADPKSVPPGRDEWDRG